MNVISICSNTAADGSKRVPAARIYEYFVYPLIYDTPGAKIHLCQFPPKTQALIEWVSGFEQLKNSTWAA